MSADLKKMIEALLFSTSDSLPVRELHRVLSEAHEQSLSAVEEGDGDEEGDLADVVPPPPGPSRLREVIREMRNEWRSASTVYDLAETPDGYRMVVRPAYADAVRLLRKEPRPTRLSVAAMETLAIIAYRQPVTRSEMERIRGVSVDSAVSRLLDHELIEAAGRADLPGRPVVYATTEKFLEFCGIASVDQLPSSDVLTPARLDDWLGEENEGGEHVPSATDMGLPEMETVGVDEGDPAAAGKG